MADVPRDKLDGEIKVLDGVPIQLEAATAEGRLWAGFRIGTLVGPYIGVGISIYEIRRKHQLLAPYCSLHDLHFVEAKKTGRLAQYLVDRIDKFHLFFRMGRRDSTATEFCASVQFTGKGKGGNKLSPQVNILWASNILGLPAERFPELVTIDGEDNKSIYANLTCVPKRKLRTVNR